MPRRVMRLVERDEDGDARLGPDLTRDVALTSDVFGDQDVAWAQPAHGAVADLDVDCPAEREHRRPSRRVVPRIAALRIEPADDDAAAGNQLPAVGLIAARREARHDLLEVRFPVRARVDADDGHVTSWCARISGRKSGCVKRNEERRARSVRAGLQRSLLSALCGPDSDWLVPGRHANLSTGREPMEQSVRRCPLGANLGHELVGHHDLGVHLASEPFQSARHVDRVADHEVVESLAVADAAHDSVAIVGADPDLDRNLPVRHTLGAPATCFGGQRHGATEGPAGIVRPRHWRSEGGHDGVADVLFERAAVLEDHVRHTLVKPLQESHRAPGPAGLADSREYSDIREALRDPAVSTPVRTTRLRGYERTVPAT